MKKTFLLAGSLWTILIGGSNNVMGQKKTSPISFADFNLVRAENGILINWKVGSDEETNFFEVEKSADGRNFKTVAYVLGADPQQSCDCFECIDHVEKKSKWTYYRLKHVSEDGSYQYSKTKSLSLK